MKRRKEKAKKYIIDLKNFAFCFLHWWNWLLGKRGKTTITKHFVFILLTIGLDFCTHHLESKDQMQSNNISISAIDLKMPIIGLLISSVGEALIGDRTANDWEPGNWKWWKFKSKSCFLNQLDKLVLWIYASHHHHHQTKMHIHSHLHELNDWENKWK